MYNKYKSWYDKIISNAQNRNTEGYTEIHHIIPRSLGGTNNQLNLVELTAREHFICHILLTKFTKGQDKRKMVRAVVFMKSENTYQNRYINSRLYESIKLIHSNNMSLSMSGEKNTFFGKKHSEETRKKMSLLKKGKYIPWNKGIPRTETEKQNISKSKIGKPSGKKGIPGKKASEETKEKMTHTRQGKSYWWNNGEKNCRSSVSTGSEWKRGRLFSTPLYSSFCKKIISS